MIRIATTEDVPSIKKVESASYLSSWTPEQYAGALTDPAYILLVSEHHDEIGGFLLARLSPIEHDTGTIEIMNIAVLAESRRKGVGRLLLDHLVILSGYRSGTIQLEVRARNRDAIEFYERVGFDTVGLRRNYYANPIDDALLMNRSF